MRCLRADRNVRATLGQLPHKRASTGGATPSRLAVGSRTRTRTRTIQPHSRPLFMRCLRADRNVRATLGQLQHKRASTGGATPSRLGVRSRTRTRTIQPHSRPLFMRCLRADRNVRATLGGAASAKARKHRWGDAVPASRSDGARRVGQAGNLDGIECIDRFDRFDGFDSLDSLD